MVNIYIYSLVTSKLVTVVFTNGWILIESELIGVGLNYDVGTSEMIYCLNRSLLWK